MKDDESNVYRTTHKPKNILRLSSILHK